VYLGIYWNNHHHLLQTVSRVSAPILWANLHLLFWLSLVPFATAWVGENHYAPVAAAVYGAVLLLAASAYYVLQLCIIASQGPDSVLRRAVGADWKGKLSLVMYAASIPLAFWRAGASLTLYVLVALIWLVPDPRIARTLVDHDRR
jgi:uncharacterized membrane protein